MQYLIIARDGKGKLAERLRVRPRHLENMVKVRQTGSVICAGGILDCEGLPDGSMLVMDFPDRSLLDAYLESEPYIQENVWVDVKVEEINVVIVNDEKVGK